MIWIVVFLVLYVLGFASTLAITRGFITDKILTQKAFAVGLLIALIPFVNLVGFVIVLFGLYDALVENVL